VSLESEDGTVECTIAEAADRALTAAEATTARVRCGIDPVDAALGPLILRDLTIVAGRPGMGKSVLAQNYGRGAAQRGHGTLLISLEMGAEQIGARALSEMTFRYDGKACPAVRGAVAARRAGSKCAACSKCATSWTACRFKSWTWAAAPSPS
jgi:hypothetical protein